MAALALALTTMGEASASADTVTVSAPAPTEEVAVPITVGWAGAPGQRVFTTSKPGPGGCGATFLGDLDLPGSTEVISTAGNGAATGTVSAPKAFDEPGTQTLCAYLQTGDDAASASAVSGPVTLTVRSAHATVGIATRPRVGAGQPLGIDLSVTTELARRVYVTIKPAGGRGCEASYSLDTSNADVVLRHDARGTQDVTVERTAPNSVGTYLLCAYVQERSDDLDPEATGSATFVVGPDQCAAAKSVLAKAQKTMKLAEAAVVRLRKLVKRKPKTYRRSYATAVRTRANAKQQLAAARAGVKNAC